jgi:AcrR family transcriptional regulator
MFKSGTLTSKSPGKTAGERTKEAILDCALELFRERGFEAATMRDIARSAKVATGAAYYYFSSKEAIVSAYFNRVQNVHAARVKEELVREESLGQRLGIVMHSKLEILQKDRMFLGALFRYTGEPGHPLSVLGKGTEAQRRQSVALFRLAMEGTEVSEELTEFLPWVMWLAHLGIILFFIHDETEGQVKTHKVVDWFVDLVGGLVELTNSTLLRPFVKPFQAKLLSMLREAGWSEEI